MTIKDLLSDLGIKDEMIVRVSGDINTPIDKGHALRKHDICTGNMVQVIEIYPNVDWTDGTCRPTYGLGGWDSGKGASVYLNTKIQ